MRIRKSRNSYVALSNAENYRAWQPDAEGMRWSRI